MKRRSARADVGAAAADVVAVKAKVKAGATGVTRTPGARAVKDCRSMTKDERISAFVQPNNPGVTQQTAWSN